MCKRISNYLIGLIVVVAVMFFGNAVAVDEIEPVYKIPGFFVPKEGIIVNTSGRCKVSVGNLFNLRWAKKGDRVVDDTRLLLSPGCSISIHFNYDLVLEIQDAEEEYDFVFHVENT